MKLRDRLNEVLPQILPQNESEAIKGKELIARLREVLGGSWSDQTLRSQFSFLVLDEQSCLARVENGQGYYLRGAEEQGSSLHQVFSQEQEAQQPERKALALAVRLYDSTGAGVFVFPQEELESWEHPDFVVVDWPAGQWVEGAYVFEDDALPSYRAICVAVVESREDLRRAFFRTLACGGWAQQCELLLLSEDDLPDDEEWRQLTARYGVGLRSLLLGGADFDKLPPADVIFKAQPHELRPLWEALPQQQWASARVKGLDAISHESRPDVAAVRGWAEGCVVRGRVESYELRVAVE